MSTHLDERGFASEFEVVRIVTCNLNGVRSAYAKGFWEWVRRQQADFICLQEVRAFEDKMPPAMREAKGYHAYHVVAERPGYSGVSIYSKQKPQKVISKMGFLDEEGRYVQLDFPKLSVASVYFPSGSSGDTRQQVKYEFLDKFYRKVDQFRKQKRAYVFCGDFNIAHKQIDIKNWKSNQKNSGFLPEERQWMDKLIDKLGYCDAFRQADSRAEQYTWWSNRGRAYEKNVGWRIDYQIVSPDLCQAVQAAKIYKRKKFSDHAPLIIDYQAPNLIGHA